MFTLEEYMTKYSEYHHRHPSQRAGQAAFNTLHIMAPDLANKVRGSDKDPFYRDSKLVPFTVWLVEAIDHGL